MSAGLLIERITDRRSDLAARLCCLGPSPSCWIVGLTNAFNLIDGIDGLAAGIAGIAGATCATILVWRGHAAEAMLLAALVGAALGFLAYNFAPASIFLGDGGSLTFGFVLATTAITGWQKGATALAAGVPLLIFALPDRRCGKRRCFAGRRRPTRRGPPIAHRDPPPDRAARSRAHPPPADGPRLVLTPNRRRALRCDAPALGARARHRADRLATIDMRRVLLVQPSLQPPGGGNGVAAWMLQALTEAHRVTVLSWTPIDVAPINRFFGTRLTTSSFDTIVVPRSWTVGVDATPLPLALVRSGLLMRYARRFSDAFDVLVGVHNEADYGRRGIQYIHYPTYFRPRPSVDFRWYHRLRPVAECVLPVRRFSRRLLVRADEGQPHADQFALDGGARAGVPRHRRASALSAGHPSSDRRPLGGSSGRPSSQSAAISPEKEFERIIRILSAVRTTAPSHLADHRRHLGSQVRGLLQPLAATGRDRASGFNSAAMSRAMSWPPLMASCRYGIHGMREEHFGMAPAEMAAAGMVVWVPAGGGQTEIVGERAAAAVRQRRRGRGPDRLCGGRPS